MAGGQSFLTGPGVSSEDAQSARQEILDRQSNVTRSSQPVRFLGDNGEIIRKVTNKFLEDGDHTPLATMLNIRVDEVITRYHGCQAGVCENLTNPSYYNPKRTDFIFTIIALDDLASALVKLGGIEVQLSAGEAVHFFGDITQEWSSSDLAQEEWSTNGRGALLWLYWRNIRTKSH
ncbi:MAG: hypothetical protein M1822_008849 [Bathelium mastoideum]|nr:MAG: hypothetical protein M1822_008849 [Bathelium mastoideum]